MGAACLAFLPSRLIHHLKIRIGPFSEEEAEASDKSKNPARAANLRADERPPKVRVLEPIHVHSTLSTHALI